LPVSWSTQHLALCNVTAPTLVMEEYTVSMIRHVIVFNAIVPEERVRVMAQRAIAVLGALPFVTDIRFGIAAAPEPRYRYYLDIGLVDEAAIETYRSHPVHVRFADEEFRPIAPDRITADYRRVLEAP
jgi:fructose-bisphosphate aldolase class II